MTVYHSGTDKQIQLKQPQQFMADEREAVENAYAGDIIGLFDPGFFHLGDALSSGPKLHFSSIPVFAPEHFARVRPEDSMKRKQFLKGILQLAEEGAIQTFRRTETGREDFLVGVVGVLQFEVLEHRLKTEYGVTMLMDRLPFRYVALGNQIARARGKAQADLHQRAAPSTRRSARCCCLKTNGPSVWRWKITKDWSWPKRPCEAHMHDLYLVSPLAGVPPADDDSIPGIPNQYQQ